jgi:hypothetical protein
MIKKIGQIIEDNRRYAVFPPNNLTIEDAEKFCRENLDYVRR